MLSFIVADPDGWNLNMTPGQVKYEVSGFLDKNRDSLQPEFRQLMQDSEESLAAELFLPTHAMVGGASSPRSRSDSIGTGRLRPAVGRQRANPISRRRSNSFRYGSSGPS